MKKIPVLILCTIVFSFIFYFFIYKPLDEQARFEEAILKLESDNNEALKQAIVDLKDIADRGHAVAQYRYAELLLKDGEVSDALDYLERSSEQGELISTELLGLTNLDSQNIEQRALGLEQINSAAKQGLSTSQLYLGMCFDDGDCGFPANQYLSMYWLEKAYENGEMSAKLFLEGRNKIVTSKITLENETRQVLCKMQPSKCQ